MDFNEFRKKFIDQLVDEDEKAINEDTKFRDLSSWDSLTAMAVIAMVDDEYKIRIPDEEFRKFNTVNDIFGYVKQH